MAPSRNIAVLLEWLKNTADEASNPSSHSYISSKIAVKEVEEFGRSIYCTEPIARSELLLRIPHSFLLNSTTAIRHITKHNDSIKLTDPYYLNIYCPANTSSDKFTQIYEKLTLDELVELSSFQLLGLYLTFEKQRGSASFWKPFIDMLPDIQDLRLTPLVWQVQKVPDWQKLIELLPYSTQVHAKKVYERFENDYTTVIKLLESKDPKFDRSMVPEDTFLWAWMCINSRCLYMDLPQSKNNHDNFTMAPYVDFLNHSSDNQCTLKINISGFQVYTTTKYQPGDQLFLSYGPHSNNFLLCEYGFVLPSGNNWNDLDISPILIKLMKPQQAEYLKDRDYFGDYTINAEGECSFRTEVALATLQEQTPVESRRLNGLINGTLDSSSYQTNSNLLLKSILEKVVHDCDLKESLEYHSDPRRQVIGLLYKDIKHIAEKAMPSLE